MKALFLGLLISSGLFAEVIYKADFPQGPDASVTPGSLCSSPDAYRYPEHIPYCNRGVDRDSKDDVFRQYRSMGYRLDPKNRAQYKIDHLIPLCAGGSNREDNLWPQHESVYKITDPMEPLACDKLKAGVIKQAQLVELIIAAKHNLNLVPRTMQYLRSL